MASCNSVTFTSCDQVLEIPSRDRYTVAEIRAAHYSKDDFKEMKRSAFETIQLIVAGKFPGEDLCMRGLKCRTTAGFSFVKNNRQKASFAVIDEQDRQDEVGISDSSLISEAYQKASLPSRCYAFAQGLLDAQEVIKDILSSQPLATQLALISATEESTSTWHFSQSLGQNVLLRVLANSIEEGTRIETRGQLPFAEGMDSPQLDSMEWTAEAA